MLFGSYGTFPRDIWIKLINVHIDRRDLLTMTLVHRAFVVVARKVHQRKRPRETDANRALAHFYSTARDLLDECIEVSSDDDTGASVRLSFEHLQYLTQWASTNRWPIPACVMYHLPTLQKASSQRNINDLFVVVSNLPGMIAETSSAIMMWLRLLDPTSIENVFSYVDTLIRMAIRWQTLARTR